VSVELSFSAALNLRFYFTNTLPIGLIDKIAGQKNEIYTRLTDDLTRPDMLSGSETFTVNGRQFEVFLAALRYDSSKVRKLRVIAIKEIK